MEELRLDLHVERVAVTFGMIISGLVRSNSGSLGLQRSGQVDLGFETYSET